ncbi:hypothetical protein BN871_EV_00110 [Paenibacillus sp. P22]|nr:hypothetical protein BN871_EV_00110 [Paenibacillus sp. P22]
MPSILQDPACGDFPCWIKSSLIMDASVIRTSVIRTSVIRTSVIRTSVIRTSMRKHQCIKHQCLRQGCLSVAASGRAGQLLPRRQLVDGSGASDHLRPGERHRHTRLADLLQGRTQRHGDPAQMHADERFADIDAGMSLYRFHEACIRQAAVGISGHGAAGARHRHGGDLLQSKPLGNGTLQDERPVQMLAALVYRREADLLARRLHAGKYRRCRIRAARGADMPAKHLARADSEHEQLPFPQASAASELAHKRFDPGGYRRLRPRSIRHPSILLSPPSSVSAASSFRNKGQVRRFGSIIPDRRPFRRDYPK